MKLSILSSERDNAKLAKSSGSGWMLVGLSLAPSKLSGKNVCSAATPGCIKGCVAFAGAGERYPQVTLNRVAKTQRFLSNIPEGVAAICRDLDKAVQAADQAGRRVACRLNVFSDLPWENMAPEIFQRFPTVQFYDYTKVVSRALAFMAGRFPPNYHLTFSRSEHNERTAVGLLLRGMNIAVVLPVWRTWALPETWHGFAVTDGDKNDLRFTDPRPCVVGLRAKGPMWKDATGFVDRSNHRQDLLGVLS